MADQKITQLTEETAPVSSDLTVMVDDPSGSPTTKKTTLENLSKGIVVDNIPDLITRTSTASSATPQPTGDSKRNELYITALSEATELQAPSGTPENGNVLIVRITDNGSDRALTYNSIYRGLIQDLPSTTTADLTLYMGFLYNSLDSRWDMVALAEEQESIS